MARNQQFLMMDLVLLHLIALKFILNLRLLLIRDYWTHLEKSWGLIGPSSLPEHLFVLRLRVVDWDICTVFWLRIPEKILWILLIRMVLFLVLIRLLSRVSNLLYRLFFLELGHRSPLTLRFIHYCRGQHRGTSRLFREYLFPNP